MQRDERFYMAIEAMTGQLCWLPQQGHGSILTVQFGEPRLKVEDARRSPTTGLTRRLVSPQGEWHIFVESGVWQIIHEGAVLADPLLHDETTVVRGLSFLSGQRLRDVQVSDTSVDFLFDLEAVLRIPIVDPEQNSPFTIFEGGKAVWPPMRA